MENSLINVYTCGCRQDFNWKNEKTYKSHMKSIRHQNYEKTFQQKEDRININKLQINHDRLERENKQLRELYINCARENMDLKEKLLVFTDSSDDKIDAISSVY